MRPGSTTNVNDIARHFAVDPSQAASAGTAFTRQNRRLRFAWTGRLISDRSSLLPFCNDDLCRNAWQVISGSLDYVVSLDGLPLSLLRSHEEPSP